MSSLKISRHKRSSRRGDAVHRPDGFSSYGILVIIEMFLKWRGSWFELIWPIWEETKVLNSFNSKGNICAGKCHPHRISFRLSAITIFNLAAFLLSIPLHTLDRLTLRDPIPFYEKEYGPSCPFYCTRPVSLLLLTGILPLYDPFEII